jgi:hypothetical protein
VTGTNVKIGHSTIKIHPLYSPGHTIDSTSFVIDEAYLLTGDILFIDSIGHPDLACQAKDWVNDFYIPPLIGFTALAAREASGIAALLLVVYNRLS